MTTINGNPGMNPLKDFKSNIEGVEPRKELKATVFDAIENNDAAKAAGVGLENTKNSLKEVAKTLDALVDTLNSVESSEKTVKQVVEAMLAQLPGVAGKLGTEQQKVILEEAKKAITEKNDVPKEVKEAVMKTLDTVKQIFAEKHEANELAGPVENLKKTSLTEEKREEIKEFFDDFINGIKAPDTETLSEFVDKMSYIVSKINDQVLKASVLKIANGFKTLSEIGPKSLASNLEKPEQPEPKLSQEKLEMLKEFARKLRNIIE